MKKIVLFALAACILAACTPKESVSVAPTAKKFYASMEQATRTFTDGENVYWINEEGIQDKVSIYYQGSTNVPYVFAGETGDTQGPLEPVDAEATPEGKYQYTYAFYPYASYNAIWSEGELYGYLSPTQYYFEDSFGIYGMNPMAAASDNDNLEFKNLAGYLKLRLYGDSSQPLAKVYVFSNNGEYIAGDIVVDIEPGQDPEIESYPDDGYANTAVAVSFEADEEPVYLDASQPLDIWVCMIPGTLEKGITVAVEAENGATFQYTSINPLTIKRSVCTATAPLEVKFPTYLGEGSITDGFICPLFGEDDITVTCSVYEDSDTPGLYTISGFQLELASEFYSYDLSDYEGVYWSNTSITVDASDPNAVTIPTCDYGIYLYGGEDADYGEAYIRSNTTGTLKKGTITFPAKGLDLGMSNWGWQEKLGNYDGTFAIVLPGSVVPSVGSPAAAPKSHRRAGGPSSGKIGGEKPFTLGPIRK